ncbi:MAG: hypothetical protein OXU77_14620 [Gammaproteobacteria bacterium]|nr:hypothetical protein [Gammaproteobacteria bacterium]MDE0441003.1 hypothetical protein [Gammaproteobacteria bacterium]
MGWFLRLTGPCAVATAFLAVAAIAGCASAPAADQANSLSVRWDLRPETDSCGKLAGSLALFRLVNIEMPDQLADQIAAELDRRCPDAEPEAFDLDVFIGEGACGELREMLGLAQVFDVTAMLDAAEKRMAVDFMDRLEDELDRRCP